MGDTYIYIYPEKLQFAAYGQFFLVFIEAFADKIALQFSWFLPSDKPLSRDI